jgi:rubrerythrin
VFPKQEITDPNGRVFLAERESRRMREKLLQEQDLTRWLEQQLQEARGLAVTAALQWEQQLQEARGQALTEVLLREQAEVVRDRLAQQLAESAQAVQAQAQAAAQKLREAEGRFDEAESLVQCIVCYASPRSYLLEACGHVIMCHACAKKVKPRACPLCKAAYTFSTAKKRRVFLS